MKRIAFFTITLGQGGCEREISTVLKAFEDRKKLCLVLFNREIFFPVPASVKIVGLRQKSDRVLSGARKIAELPFLAFRYSRICRKEKIEISVSYNTRANYVNVLSKVFGNKARIILNEQNYLSNLYGEGDLKSKINRWLVRRLYKHCDGLRVNAKRIGVDLADSFDVPVGKIQTLYNPLDVSYIHSMCEAEPSKPLPEGFNFVTVGRLAYQKNQRMLLKAFERFKGKPINLILLGDGELRGELEQYAISLGIGDNVHFWGLQQNVFSIISRCDCFVFSSLFEGFPNALQEALACGLPVVSTDCVSGPRELLAPDTDIFKEIEIAAPYEIAAYGVLVRTGNADSLAAGMELMVSDPALRQSLRDKAAERAVLFPLDEFLNKYDNML